MTPASTLSTRLVEAVDVPLDDALAARIAARGTGAVLAEQTQAAVDRLEHHLADPMATDSQAAYAAWLRRQLAGWAALRLPSAGVSGVGWPLSSVRPQCVDVVGLIIADLRELSPRTRPTLVPAQATSPAPVPTGVAVGVADLCVRAARPASRLLASAQALTAGLTRTGSATRYLARCCDLAERAPGLAREIDAWAATAEPAQVGLALRTSAVLAERLADALDAGVRKGW